MNKIKKNTIIFRIIIGVIIIGCVIFFATGDLRQYNEGKTLLSSGKYEDAKKIFAELKDYKDSENQILECDYQIGKKELSEENYIISSKIFKELADVKYSDSEEFYKESQYNLGKKYIEVKDYENAVSCLQGLNFEDSE